MYYGTVDTNPGETGIMAINAAVKISGSSHGTEGYQSTRGKNHCRISLK